MYEAFMADYGLMPDETDERFSLRQMSLLLSSRSKRKKAESRIAAQEIWEMAMGGESFSEPKMVPFSGSNKKSMSYFGIKSPSERR